MAVRALILFAAAVLPGVPPAQSRDGGDGRRTARVGSLDGAAAPRIDGYLDEKCWESAPSIGELVMVEPWEGGEPTNPTVIKLLHDRHFLYIGIYCYDDDPAGIRATQRARDARLDPDDRVEILLDTFENRRTGYFFQIGAGGSIGDALISANGTRFSKPWDAVWDGRARVAEDGWVAEIAIPFRSIPREDGRSSWGFNVRRYARTRNEEYQWANPVQSVPFFRISELGRIEGFGEIDGGMGLEVVPYVTFGVARDRAVDPDTWNSDIDTGGEIYYRITPSMTLAATAYTDFAETEDDSRRINFNRFPLFFPEKRDFFLQGTSYFTFGSQFAGSTRFLPFFTRRIGLDGSGNKVPLLGGIKLTGEAGPFEIGLLDVQTDDTSSLDGENLGIARLKYALGEQTTVGLLATNGDPSGTSRNGVYGVDFYQRWSEFLGDMDLQMRLEVLSSTGSDSDDDGESFAFDLRSRGAETEFQIGSRWVSEDFDPALGFVSRRGVRSSAVSGEYTPRLAQGGSIRNLEFEVGIKRTDEWDGRLQDLAMSIDRLGLRFHSGDRIRAFFTRGFERVDADFSLFRGTIPVFAGDYWTTRGGIRLQTTDARPWDCEVRLSTGGFFDGTRDTLDVSAKWRFSGFLSAGADYSLSRVDLGPGRGFDVHVTAVRADLHFTPRLSLFNLGQFDNESNAIGWQSRLRWIYSPGCDFFAVLSSGWGKELDGSFVPTEQSLQLKISHSLRF